MVGINMKQGFEIEKLFVVLAHFPWRQPRMEHIVFVNSAVETGTRFYVGT